MKANKSAFRDIPILCVQCNTLHGTKNLAPRLVTATDYHGTHSRGGIDSSAKQ